MLSHVLSEEQSKDSSDGASNDGCYDTLFTFTLTLNI